MEEKLKRAKDKVVHTQVWRSIFRQGWHTTERNRVLTTINTLLLHLHPIKVKTHALKIRYTFCLGGATLFMFVIETITGLLLMYYYRPTLEYAYQDMKDLEFTVTFGLFLRNMHRWAAHLMVLTVILHMCRVFYTGAYKPPREFNWVIGVLLLVITLLLSFTGYLLPWDQLAFWAITVGTSIAAYTPIVGPGLRYFLLGGNEVGQTALLRFYVLYV